MRQGGELARRREAQAVQVIAQAVIEREEGIAEGQGGEEGPALLGEENLWTAGVHAAGHGGGHGTGRARARAGRQVPRREGRPAVHGVWRDRPTTRPAPGEAARAAPR